MKIPKIKEKYVPCNPCDDKEYMNYLHREVENIC